MRAHTGIGGYRIGHGTIGNPEFGRVPRRFQQARAGQEVRYFDGTRVHHAHITAVTSDTVVDIKVGRDIVEDVTRATVRNTVGWFFSLKELAPA